MMKNGLSIVDRAQHQRRTTMGEYIGISTRPLKDTINGNKLF